MAKHPYPDYQKVRLKNRYQDVLVPYGEVRLGIHDPTIPEAICKEAQVRMGSEREATVYEIQKEHKNAKRRERTASEKIEAPTFEEPKKKIKK